MWELLEHSLRAILDAAAAAGLPVLATALLWSLVSRLAPRDFHDVPVVQRLAVVAGLLLAVGVVLGGPTAASFSRSDIFAIGGPWDLSLGEFLRWRIAVPDRIVARMILAFDADEWRAVYPATGGLALAAGTALAGFHYWRGRAAVLAAAAAAVLAVGIAVIGFYAAEASLWLIHKLNFWAFLVLAVLYQSYRHRGAHA